MAAAGQDAILLYTNFIRSGAVSHLTAFSPYWADGVLLVPQKGEPIFATTLSKRVGSWIQSVKPVGELVTSPTPGTVLAQKLAAGGGIRRLAILELDNFPSGLYGEVAAALPGTEIVDGSETFALARAHLDDVERHLLGKAQSMAQVALERLRSDTTTDVGTAVGAVEEYARLQGAEEVYVAIAPDLDSDRRFIRLSGKRPLGCRFAMRATLAYKGAWIRQTKTHSRDDEDALPIRQGEHLGLRLCEEGWVDGEGRVFERFLGGGGEFGACLRRDVIAEGRGVGGGEHDAEDGRAEHLPNLHEVLTAAGGHAHVLVVDRALDDHGHDWAGHA